MDQKKETQRSCRLAQESFLVRQSCSGAPRVGCFKRRSAEAAELRLRRSAVKFKNVRVMRSRFGLVNVFRRTVSTSEGRPRHAQCTEKLAWDFEAMAERLLPIRQRMAGSISTGVT